MAFEELYNPITFFCESGDSATASASKDDDSFNLSYFMSDDAKILGEEDAIEKELKKQERKSRSKSSTPAVVNASIPANQINTATEVPYITTYEETNNMIRNTILQADILSAEIKGDIDDIRKSKTLKGRYTYLTNLNSAAASLISAKLSAIKELNSSITQAHNLELKRAKDLKELADDKKNDDARMMDLYSAFINAPMGMYDNKLNMPTIPDMMLGVNDPYSGITGVSMGAGTNGSGAISPEQMRMRMENNPNVEEIVVFDPSTGRKWFDVIDKSTGQSIPNYPRPDSFILEDVSIETRAGIAKNRNLDKVWPLKVLGGVNMTEY